MDISKKGLLAILAIVVLLCSGCRTDETQVIETKPANIIEVMSLHTIVEIADAPDTSSLSGEAIVQITMPDICRIYMDLLEKGKANTMSIEDICVAITEYANHEDFLLVHDTTASVIKESNEWMLNSNECIDALTEQQIDDLLILMMNDIGTIEISGGTE